MADAPTFAFLGCGHMGMAVLRGALANGMLVARETLVVEASQARRAEAAELGAQVSASAAHAAHAPRMLLAVKPQSFEAMAAELRAARAASSKGALPTVPGPLAVSVMAGWSSASIAPALGGARVVRTMPNLPAQIGLGMTAVAPGAGVAPEDIAFVEGLFEGIGRTVRVREDQLDAVTAVSGSGPAYLFLLAEAQVRAALGMGFDEQTARALVRQTLLGAATLLADGPQWADELRAAVTSRGGTTEAAIRAFEAGDFAGVVASAMAAARDRGRELGR